MNFTRRKFVAAVSAAFAVEPVPASPGIDSSNVGAVKTTNPGTPSDSSDLPRGVIPFRVTIPQARLDALRRRLSETVWPDAPDGGGWKLGTEVSFMKELTAYWIDGFDWRAQETRINRFPQFRASVDGQKLHFLYERSSNKDARPLLLMHGWPYSYVSLIDIVEPLAHPERFGGSPADAFHVVVPSFPGFAFSDKPLSPMACRDMGHLCNKLMTEVLGYDHYVAAGGDWGGHTAEWMGFDHADHVDGIHTHIASVRPANALRGSGGTGGIRSEALEAFMQKEKREFPINYAYALQQSTAPQSLAFGMNDSPVGAAAWIIGKFYDWSDHRSKPFTEIFTRDQLLTEVMIYQLTGTFNTSTWIYAGSAGAHDYLPVGERIGVPVAIADFADPVAPIQPREFVELTHNVVQWTDFHQGGHFPFYQMPTEYIADIRKFSALLRLREALNN